MGLSHSPRIVTDGLVLCLDAANSRSYPGTGTTWTDLKGGNNGTLTNMDGANFSSENSGSLSFDGSNEYITTGTTNLDLTDMSICCWVNFSSKSGSWKTISNKEVSNTNRNWWVGLDGNGTNRFSFLRSVNGSDTVLIGNVSPDLNRWYFYCGTCTSTPVFSTYINGELDASNSHSGSLSTAGTSNVIGRYAPQNLYYINAKIGSISYYNKALTADEVRQNYLATKERYA